MQLGDERGDQAVVHRVDRAVQRVGRLLAVDVPSPPPQLVGEREDVEPVGVGGAEGDDHRVGLGAQLELGIAHRRRAASSSVARRAVPARRR